MKAILKRWVLRACLRAAARSCPSCGGAELQPVAVVPVAATRDCVSFAINSLGGTEALIIFFDFLSLNTSSVTITMLIMIMTDNEVNFCRIM